MEKGSSPLDTLRQLQELLDAGTITRQEFETLKGRLLAAPTVPLNPTFITPAPALPTTEAPSPAAEPTPVAAPSPAPAAPAPPVEDLPTMLDFFKQPQASSSPPAPPAPPIPMREEKPVQFSSPVPPPAPAPVTPPAAPEFSSPRPSPPPVSSAPTPTPQFYPPTPPPPAPPVSATPPDFFSPKPQPAPPIPTNPRPAPQPSAAMQADEVEEPARSSPLGKILAIGGGLLLLLLVWYLLMGQSRSNERLTSISQTAADTVAVEPETGPQAEQQELPAAATPETVRVAPIIPPAAATDSVANESGSTTEQTQAQEPSNTPAASDTAPKTAESADEATSRVRDVLTAYYADIQAAPFSADQYFAPQVELFVILRNTTPAAISAWLEQNRFPEVKDAQIQVEPGTLRVSPPTSDGSRVATYIERGRAFRQSLQKNQYLRAQMRLRVNADYKITYQKQERLLENVLSDATAQ